MNLSSSFDRYAPEYDAHFTHQLVGKYQRQRVWLHMGRIMPSTPISILEVNGGTGEDALWLAKQGHRVTVTDASSAMIAVVRQKIQETQCSHVEAKAISIQQETKPG